MIKCSFCAKKYERDPADGRCVLCRYPTVRINNGGIRMSNAKVTISNGVADAIEYVRSCGVIDDEIIRNCFGSYVGSACPARKLLGTATYENPTLITSAIINGYEREQTAEQRAHVRIREKYESHRHGERYNEHMWFSREEGAFANGIKFALDTLGIKIEGVNAE